MLTFGNVLMGIRADLAI